MTTEPVNVVIPVQRQTSVLAVVSFLFGLTWWFGVGSFIAVVFGHLARQEVREEGKSGDVLAVFGLVLGYFGLIPVAFIVLGWITQAIVKA